MITAIYRQSTDELLLANTKHPALVLTVPARDALQLADAIATARAAPARAIEHAAPSHLARWPKGMRA